MTMTKTGRTGIASNLEETLYLQIRAMKLPIPEREYRFHPERRWRFDFAWPDRKLAVEVHGGTYSGGRHVRGNGFTNDLEKIGEAMKGGWNVYCCDCVLVKNGQAVEIIKSLLEHAK